MIATIGKGLNAMAGPEERCTDRAEHGGSLSGGVAPMTMPWLADGRRICPGRREFSTGSSYPQMAAEGVAPGGCDGKMWTDQSISRLGATMFETAMTVVGNCITEPVMRPTSAGDVTLVPDGEQFTPP